MNAKLVCALFLLYSCNFAAAQICEIYGYTTMSVTCPTLTSTACTAVDPQSECVAGTCCAAPGTLPNSTAPNATALCSTYGYVAQAGAPVSCAFLSATSGCKSPGICLSNVCCVLPVNPTIANSICEIEGMTSLNANCATSTDCQGLVGSGGAVNGTCFSGYCCASAATNGSTATTASPYNSLICSSVGLQATNSMCLTGLASACPTTTAGTYTCYAAVCCLTPGSSTSTTTTTTAAGLTTTTALNANGTSNSTANPLVVNAQGDQLLALGVNPSQLYAELCTICCTTPTLVSSYTGANESSLLQLAAQCTALPTGVCTCTTPSG